MRQLFTKYSKNSKAVILAIMFVVSLFTLGLYPILKARAAPNPPTNLQAVQYSSTQVNLTWQDNSTEEWSYSLDRSPTGTDPWTTIATLSTNATSYSNTGLETNKNYCYRVGAVGTGGASYSNTACASTIAPVWVGKTSAMGEAYLVKMSGNYAYVTSSLGLQIIDITNLSNPLIIGTLDLQFAYGVAVDNSNHAFVNDGTSVKVVDVTDKTNPRVIGSLELPDFIYGLELAGSTLYSATYQAGLVMVDVSNPTAPAIIRTIDTPGQASKVAVSGNIAYVADGTSGLQIINLTSNTIVGSLAMRAYDVEIKNNYAYVAAGTTGMIVADISNPTTPSRITSIRVKDTAVGLDLSGDYAYVASSSYSYQAHGLQIFNISNPTAPVESSFTMIFGRTRGGIATNGSAVSFTAEWGGFSTIDVTNPQAPSLEAVFPQIYRSMAVAANGTRLVAMTQLWVGSRLFTFDATSSSPKHMGSMPLDGMPHDGPIDVELDASGYAYVGDYNKLKIINVSNLSNPQLVGQLYMPDRVYGVYLANDKVYTANYQAGISIVDISDKASPRILSTIDTPGEAYAVAVNGNTAVVADGSAGVRVINLTSPASAVALPIPGAGATAWDVQIDPATNKAYVAAGSAGLVIVDIANPASPSIIKTVPTRDAAKGVALAGNKAVIASFSLDYSSNGLQIIDISNPASAYETSFHPAPGLYVRSVVVSSHYAYVTDDRNLIDILDLNGPPTEPTLTKSADKTSVRSNEEITYSLTAANPTTDTFTNLNLSDPIPTGTTYLTGQSTKPSSCTIDESHTNDPTDPKIIFTCPSIAPNGQTGDTLNFMFKVRVN